MSTRTPSRQAFVITTVITATTAALAAAASLTLMLPVWAMFIGWIAFFTRIDTLRTTAENLACVGLGMVIGMLASLAIPQFASIIGLGLGLPVVVFFVALVVVALRGLPLLNNLLSYFLGLVSWFAAHLDPSLESMLQLFSASMVGSIAGWLSHIGPTRLLPRSAGA